MEVKFISTTRLTEFLSKVKTWANSTFITEHQDVSDKESKDNKVTTLNESSTDTQYPSAKCVYDMIGNIETLLEEL